MFSKTASSWLWTLRQYVRILMGDELIASVSLVPTILLAGKSEWPHSLYQAIAVIAILIGLG